MWIRLCNHTYIHVCMPQDCSLYTPVLCCAAGFLRPSVHITAGLHDVHSDFQKLESAATAYFLRIVTTGGLLCAATVGAGFLLWRSRPA